MDEQVEILRAIWNEMKALNGRVDKTNSRLDVLRTELKEAIGATRVELKGELEAVRTQLKDEIGATRIELRSELEAVRTQLKEEIGATRIELKVEVGSVRAELGGLRTQLGRGLVAARDEISAVRYRSLERDGHLAGAIRELRLDIRELTGAVHSWRDEHRLDREELRERVARLERHAGFGSETT